MDYCFCIKDNVKCFEMSVYPCGHVYYKCCSQKLIKTDFIDCPQCKEPINICIPVHLFTKPYFRINDDG